MRTTQFLALALCLLASASALSVNNSAPSNDWWDIPYPSQFDVKSLKTQSFISVKGNKFIDDKGKTFTFRGVNIADTGKLLSQNQWQKSLFEELANNWGVNTIRLPIHPVSWRKLGPDVYLGHIDEAVRWANDLGIYLILDWHSIGYLPTEQYQHPMYDTTIKETRDFWRRITFRYKNVPTVAVYELFNEPTTMGNTLGERNWAEWKTLNESLIDMIYASDKTVIPLVAGFNWAYDLSPIKKAPIEREGIAYAAHPYPQKAKPEVKNDKNFFKLWNEKWGFAADTYPVIATELGWVQPDGYGAHIPVKDDGSYGPRIVKYMQKKGVSYTVWVFDPDWSPTMINDWDFTPSEQGAFFKQVMLEAKKR